ncbi:MAG: prolipoprotein diacylglyceryl transferase [Armatimonadota bacterium]|nr:prolipoprotein diacylglyceryl transferase [Armatimonadota bacterium]MDW8156883.1 prolipoprotein diacylglyceryl transferase [Armatimonadota bacterium]
MDPTVLQVGSVRVTGHGVVLLLAFAVGLWHFVRGGRRAELAPQDALDLGLYLLVAGLVGARLGHVLAHAGAYAHDPQRVFWVWQDGGLAFYGGVAGCAVACRWLRPRDWAAVLDHAAPAAAVAYAVGAVGTLWTGLFLGKPTDVPWAVDAAGTLRHPVGAYLALASVAAYRLLEPAASREHPPGQVALTYLLLQSTARAASDVFVDPQTTSPVLGPFTAGQLSAAAVALGSALGLWASAKGRAGHSAPPPP